MHPAHHGTDQVVEILAVVFIHNSEFRPERIVRIDQAATLPLPWNMAREEKSESESFLIQKQSQRPTIKYSDPNYLPVLSRASLR